MHLLSPCSAVLAFAGVTLSAPTSNSLHSRAVVNHDSLFPIETRVQTGVNGEAIIRFNPRLHIASGCQAYTAVDDAGNTSGGVEPGGGSVSSCGDPSRGQTYARMGTYNGHIGIMYAWYFPKDQLTDYITYGSHKHDWEGIVVWLADDLTTVLGGAVSGHGGWTPVSGSLTGGDSAMVEYYALIPTNHELQFKTSPGVLHPVSDWDAMPTDERNQLEWTDFGQAIVPFKDGTFMKNLAKAAL